MSIHGHAMSGPCRLHTCRAPAQVYLPHRAVRVAVLALWHARNKPGL